MLKPRLIIIAGANGCGKTTIKKNLMASSWTAGCEYINPDDIALEKFGGWDKKENFEQAQKFATDLTYQNLAERKDMVLETAFSSERKLKLVADAKQAGYFIRLYFISTKTPEINAARVCRRMLGGGHEVLLSHIIKRHAGAFKMCIEASPMVDRLYVFDNSIDGESPRELFRARDGYLHKAFDAVLEFTWSKIMLERVVARLEDAQEAVIEERAAATDECKAVIAQDSTVVEVTKTQDHCDADVVRGRPK